MFKKLIFWSFLVPVPLSYALTTDSDVNLDHFNKIITGVTIDKVKESEIGGGQLFEVFVNGSPFPAYVTKDGKYMLEGNAIDLMKGVNITKDYVTQRNKEVISIIDDSEMVIYKSPVEKYVITVFTTTDCPFCRMLHKQMNNYLAQGITVRYLAFPFQGLNSNGYFDMVSVFCAADRNKTMDDAVASAERGMPSAPNYSACENPVADQYALAVEMGVTGTPSIILDDGTMIDGYISAVELRRMLDEKNMN